MKKIKIPNAEVQELLSGKSFNYPKYSTQLMNLANQNAQGTRAKVVGQMSDLIQEFKGSTLSDWEKWYLEKHPEAIDNATEKVYAMISLLKESITKIDRNTIKSWIKELVIVKTFSGLRFQEAILKKVAQLEGKIYRLAMPEEESKGIDGFIGTTAVSIKPHTYNIKRGLKETINVYIIYYTKNKNEVIIEYNEKFQD